MVFKADVDLDFKSALYATSIVIANFLMVYIRKNPGIVTVQIVDPPQVSFEEKPSSEEFELDQKTNYQLGTTLKMRELHENLLEPVVSLRAPQNIVDYEDDHHSDESGDEEHRERYDSVETIREGQ